MALLHALTERFSPLKKVFLKVKWLTDRLDIHRDFGLSRLALLVLTFDIFLSLFGLIFCGKFYFQSFVVLTFNFLILLFWKKIVQWHSGTVFFIHSLNLLIFMWFNYEMIGFLDAGLGGLPLYDFYFSDWDIRIFQAPVAEFFQRILEERGLLTTFIYDMLMLSYMTYYFLPFSGVLLFFLKMAKKEYYLLGRFTGSIFIMFLLTFTSYLLVPVTGPQYYLQERFLSPLPFGPWGGAIYYFIYSLHPTYIDCFPSGHAGLAYLMCLWVFKWGFKGRYIYLLIAILITFSTLLLRFHYLLDVLAALPLAVTSFYLAKVFFPLEETCDAVDRSLSKGRRQI